MSDAGSLDGVTRWRTSLGVSREQGVSIEGQRSKRRCSGVVVRRATATAAAVVLGLTASGCSSSGDASSTALTSSTSSPSSAAPTAANPSQDAQSKAVAFVSTYLGMIDDLRLDASRPLDDIYQVAVAPEATAQASAIGELRSQDYRQTGRSRLVTAAVEGAPGNSDAAAAPPGLPTVVVSACVDVTDVGAVDAAGESVVPPGRPGFLIAQLTMVNPRQIDASSWRVSEAVNRQAQSCSG